VRRAALVVLVLLAGCGDDDDAVPTVTSSTSTTTSSTSSTTATTTTTTSSTTLPEQDHDEGIGDLEVALVDLLIRPDELGDPTFADVGYTPTERPPTCGVDLDADHPGDALVGTTLQSDEAGVTIEQDLRAFASVEAAAEAMSATRAAYACGDGPDDISYLPAEDVTAEVGGDEAFSIRYAVGQQAEGSFVVARVTDVLLTFGFAGSGRGGPDRTEVAAFGVGKLLALLEQGG
jgi:hypothetical protein